MYSIKNHQKRLQQFNQVTLIMEESMIGIKDSKAFYFEFDWPKVVDENFKHQIEFIIKSNKSLAKNKVRKEIKQLLSKYKHENNIHEHRKQQNE